ncbi:MAG TPA: tetratricopeptide repeat protein [Methylophilaceae bacterium]
MQNVQARTVPQYEIQSLMLMLNSGSFAQAETAARHLLQQYPGTFFLYNALGVALENQQKFSEAEQVYRQAIAIDSRVAEIHFNLGVVLGQLGRNEEAIASYRKAVMLRPNLAPAYFNLGFALQQAGRLDEAVAAYRRATQIEPGFYEAHGNLGAVLQLQGKLEDAIASYRSAIAIHPDARGYFNLGTALRNEGLLDDAIKSFEQALALDPNYAEAHSNLGESLWYRGRINEAIAHFHQALAIDPDNASANYNLAVFLYDNNELERAIPYFERSRFDDWRERTLYCLYKTERYDEFRARLQEAIDANSCSPLLATLSTHHAINFGVEDTYNFCNNPLDFVYHGRIDELAEPDSPLLKQLLHDINEVEATGRVQSRMQSRLHHGVQSSGNLFKRPEASFRKLAELIADTVRRYYLTYKDQNCAFIREFPENIEFSSSWYVRMRQGGHLDSHIHEEGWISGAVYLAMPKQLADEKEGCIELSTHGDNYPQKHNNFPTRLVRPQVGDVCFFPSSVFHRTIPFSSDEERICVAFDVKPQKASRRMGIMS